MHGSCADIPKRSPFLLVIVIAIVIVVEAEVTRPKRLGGGRTGAISQVREGEEELHTKKRPRRAFGKRPPSPENQKEKSKGKASRPIAGAHGGGPGGRGDRPWEVGGATSRA